MSSVVYNIQLDQDLLETIFTVYPEWFEEFVMAENDTLQSLTGGEKMQLGSPQAAVDEASIQDAMDRNKESLKMRLSLRRPINQLIDQNILPPHKASPSFYEQSKKLARARLEDFLKHKIQRRPDRQALIQQHILEDTSVSPSLQDKQRQLKKARLADDLNDRLSHRPGPLELVKGNILKADDRLAQAIKEGQIQFKATCEGEAIKHPPPLFHIEDKDESFSEGTPSPPQAVPSPSDYSQLTNASEINSINISPVNDFSSNSFASLTVPSPAPSSIFLASPVTSLIPSPPLSQSQPLFVSNLCTINNAPVLATADGSTFVAITPSVSTANTVLPNSNQKTINVIKPSFTPGIVTKSESSKSRKKSKSKNQQKSRTIKFHEYKGPPNAQKNQNILTDPSESSYELLLKQQQLFLQWQLEWQQKYPQLILPTNHKLDQQQGSTMQTTLTQPAQTLLVTSRNQTPDAVHFTANNICTPPNLSNITTQSFVNGAPMPGKIISKLEGMKVCDLKVELKKRNMPVSGSKPQLVERLKPFADEVFANSNTTNINVAPVKKVNKEQDKAKVPATEAKSDRVKTRKKSIKSQDVDDILDILIKNGELSPSAANEPQTPSTPDKRSNFMLPFVAQNSTEHIVPSKTEKVNTDCKLANNHNDSSSVIDFSLELQEIVNSLDFSALIQDEDRMSNNDSMTHCDENRNNTQPPQSDVKPFLNTDFSLNEIMDFRQSPVQMDWMSDFASTNVQPSSPADNDRFSQKYITYFE